MKPRGLLMTEHRLIEKLLKAIKNRINNIDENSYDPLFVDTVVDFIRTYADRTHHGKEEDILFKKLEEKNISGQDKIRMKELMDEHVTARGKVRELVDLNKQFRSGNRKSVIKIIEILNWLISFYPEHIKKEDKVFFPDTEKLFTAGELDVMLMDFNEFDRKMIHEKYQGVYESLSK